jgi:hypothetical protein
VTPAPRFTLGIRRTTTNRTGGRVDVGSFTIPGCTGWPGTSSEELDRRDEVTTTYTVSVPAGAPEILPTDEAVLPDGTVWQVNGSVQRYTGTVNSATRGVLVQLQRGTG